MNEEEIENKFLEYDNRLAKLESVFQDGKNLDALSEIQEGQITFDILAKKTSIDLSKLKELFDFDEDSMLTLLINNGKDIKEKTQNITLVILLAYKYCLNKEALLSQEIRRNVAENSISLSNFGTYLNELSPSLVRRRGKAKSNQVRYRLTVLGEVKAKEKLKELVKGVN